MRERERRSHPTLSPSEQPASPRPDEREDPRSEASEEPARLRGGVARAALFCLGLFFSLLGTLGAFLPVLPTTPFLLLASACFVRSSPAFHERLLANRVVGPYLAQWQADHTVPLAAKRKAYGLVVVSFALSIFLIDRAWVRIGLAVVGALLLAFLAWLPVTERAVEESRAPD